MEKDLQKTKLTTLSLEKTSDIFKCKPIRMQIAEHGDIEVKTELRVSLEKCAIGLGIKMSDQQVEIICDDLCDVYSFESIEDIQQCFKKARQGKYRFGHNRRDVITMALVKEWMSEYLEEKAKEREKIIHNRKSEIDFDGIPTGEAQKYIAKIKEIISKSKLKETTIKPFDGSQAAWAEAIKNDPLLKAHFEKIYNKK